MHNNARTSPDTHGDPLIHPILAIRSLAVAVVVQRTQPPLHSALTAAFPFHVMYQIAQDSWQVRSVPGNILAPWSSSLIVLAGRRQHSDSVAGQSPERPAGARGEVCASAEKAGKKSPAGRRPWIQP